VQVVRRLQRQVVLRFRPGRADAVDPAEDIGVDPRRRLGGQVEHPDQAGEQFGDVLGGEQVFGVESAGGWAAGGGRRDNIGGHGSLREDSGTRTANAAPPGHRPLDKSR
jgi:hypothetical protein